MPLPITLFTLSLLACDRAGVLSPSDGSEQSAPWIPVTVQLPESYAGGEAALWLDGRSVTDSLGLIRDRVSFRGGGADYIATLDLIDLEPGEHELRMLFDAPWKSTIRETVTFTYAPHPCEVTARVSDGAGNPLSARVLVVAPDGASLNLAGPDAEAADPSSRDAALRSFTVLNGEGRVTLPEGQWRLLATRSLRDHIDEATVDCGAGAQTIDFTLPPAIETPGWLTADLHVHSGYSADAFVPDRVRYRAVAASGLDVMVLTDHNKVGRPQKPLDEVLAGFKGAKGLPGTELRLGLTDPNDSDDEDSAGHLNAFPLASTDEAPLPPTWRDRVASQIEDLRDRQREAPYEGEEDVLIQLNHPRGIQFFPTEDVVTGAHALFNRYNFDPSLPLDDPANAWAMQATAAGTTNLDFDVIEVMNRFSWGVYLSVRRDWFNLLSQGWWMTGAGNSDSHAYEVEQVGFPVNLVACPPPGHEALDTQCFMDAIRRGRVTVSSGPVVDIAVLGPSGWVGPGERLTSESGEVEVEVRVRAAPWVPVAEVRLITDGELAALELVDGAIERNPDGVLDARWRWTVPAERWVLAEAGWSLYAEEPDNKIEALGDYGLIAEGHLPAGFTNPVRLD